jgi:N-acetylneuraminic acid mutarotase
LAGFCLLVATANFMRKKMKKLKWIFSFLFFFVIMNFRLFLLMISCRDFWTNLSQEFVTKNVKLNLLSKVITGIKVKKALAILFILTFLASIDSVTAESSLSSQVTENFWSTKTPMNTARAYPGVAAVNGKIYVIGGDVGSICAEGTIAAKEFTGEVPNVTEAYEPALDIWVLLADMPTQRARFGTTVCDGKIYCIGGRTATGMSVANEVFDPVTNSWSTKASLPNSVYPVLVNSVDGKIYVTSAGKESLMVYNPATDSWSNVSAPLYQISSWASTAVDGEIYFIATDYAYDSQGNIVESSRTPFVEVYDIATDNWSRRGDAPTYGTVGACGATSGESAPKQIYFFGEYQTYVYNLLNDTWATCAVMPSCIPFGFGVGVIEDVFYIVGGFIGQHDLFVFMSPSSVNSIYYPYGYGKVSPTITICSPTDVIYDDSIVPLVFTVDKPVDLMCYSLDGQANITITGNTTLTNLSNGLHNLTLYAKYAGGLIGVSENLIFSTKLKPFSGENAVCCLQL